MSQRQDSPTLRTDVTLREFDPYLDVPLQVSIEVGRLRLRGCDLVKLATGSVIELRKPAGEPFEICVNGVTVGRGEVIVVDQLASIRIVEIQRLGALAL